MKAGFCSFSHCAVLWFTQIIGYVIAQWLCFVCLLFLLPHYHHYAGRRIWKYWTSKIVVRYIRSSVCIKSSQFSQLYFMQYMGLCVFSLSISPVMIVGIYVFNLIFIIKSEAWPNCYCLGLGHETVVCAACLSIFLLVFTMAGYITKGKQNKKSQKAWYIRRDIL